MQKVDKVKISGQEWLWKEAERRAAERLVCLFVLLDLLFSSFDPKSVPKENHGGGMVATVAVEEVPVEEEVDVDVPVDDAEGADDDDVEVGLLWS